MPCLRGSFDPRTGIPLIKVMVFPPGTCVLGGPPPVLGMEVNALLDTGTRTTCITPEIVQGLHLSPPQSTRQLSGAMQAGAANVHYIDLVLPLNAAGLHPSLEVLELGIHYDSLQVLIGLDILCRGVFTMSFDGHFTLAI